MVETIRCPDCGKNHVIKKGKRKMKYRTLQIYYCKICRKRFVRKELKDKGTPIPENDIWIAATCMIYEIPLATNDKHFNNIIGLTLNH